MSQRTNWFNVLIGAARLVAGVLMGCAAQGAIGEEVVGKPPITALAYSSRQGELLVGSQAGLGVFGLDDRRDQRAVELDISHIHDLAFSPDGRRLAVAGGWPAVQGRLIVLDWPSARQLVAVSAGDDVFYSVAWVSGGQSLVTAAGDRMVAVRNAKNLSQIRDFRGHSRAVLAVASVADSQALVSCGRDQTIRIWNSENGALIRKFDNHTGEVRDLSVRPAADDAPPQLVSAGGDRTVRFWRPTIGRMLRFARLDSQPLAVTWLRQALPGSESAVAVGCDDGHVRIIDAESLAVVHDCLALDGWVHALLELYDRHAIVAGGTGGRWKLIDLTSPQPSPAAD